MEIAKIDDAAFGDLIHLPKLYEQNKAACERAEAAVALAFEPWSKVDIKKIKPEEAEALLAPIIELRGQLLTAHEFFVNDRTPHTRKMSAIASVFIDLEKRIDIRRQQCAGAENAWVAEIIRRKKEQEDAAAAFLKEKQKEIDACAEIQKQILANFQVKFSEQITQMVDAFYKKSIEELDDYIKTLYDWLKTATIEYSVLLVGLEGTMGQILKASSGIKSKVESLYKDSLTKQIDDLADKVAGRKEQLRTNSAPPVEFTAENALNVADDLLSIVEDKQNADSLNAAFSSQAQVDLPAPSGRIKKKYVVESKEAMQAIMQSWVTFNMPLLSMEELNTKLSFMRTAAAQRLNDGHPPLEAKGLSIVEDVQTRTRREPR